MSSWRDSDDPSCPSCGEPISATASYCMHCGTEFDGGDSADPIPSEDVSPDTNRDQSGTGGDQDGGVLSGIIDAINATETQRGGGGRIETDVPDVEPEVTDVTTGSETTTRTGS